ncbi:MULTISPECIES: hypothetical protein [Aerococcus]|uniref:hypothetical protein n=1 Tax=Aerococcus TaxID=1375 RepID=UPI000DCAF864|nr:MULTISPECIES: hypothetical protein [Aerococcus]KAA9299824.1 hypothetical protein F6I08_00180 [Aerococcus tenax]MDK8133236.1 hypothetical protein [Aerococcus urinae]MDK8484803.1 hypothetical protein [Aerococcus urinae]MDL5178292.1 hypothetical protein [Aerococcus tenax]MDL5207307.1 hypothetical protein [Aerococcus tenax]
MTKDEIKEVRVHAKLATAGLRIDEAKSLINIIDRKVYLKAVDLGELAEWGNDEIIEYAFECAEVMTQLQSLTEVLDESIIETNYSLKELDKLLFGGSEESEDEAPADLKETAAE